MFAGRDNSACGLALMDAGLSRRHAEIWLENGYTYVRDLGSSNGTWVNGRMLGHETVALVPGMNVYLGTVPLALEWRDGGQAQAMPMPEGLRQQIEARQQQVAQMHAAPAQAPAQPMAGIPQTTPGDLVYRKQGSNDNGVLLLALKQDTFWNGSMIDGFVEFTSLDHQTVASVTVELVERHRRGPSGGHVWDRVLVRQGPWRAAHGDVMPLPFQLRTPPGTAVSGRDCVWEIRGSVDINWAVDVDCTIDINMRNADVERVRDSFGALDYRLAELDSHPLGQRFDLKFQPPAQLRSKLGVNDITVALEYLGANLKVMVELDKRGMFKSDQDLSEVFDLARFRSAQPQEVVGHFAALIQKMMG
ncbi:MAG TPA: FHA domain-containing protein [Kofleriaceae bacterium]|nr:FHA domain-containing protein [Kofleriaceae bacterium]